MTTYRVFLETSVIGGFLRDSPERLGDFKEAEKAGFRYYSSTDVVSELGCNSDLRSLTEQLAMLRSLVADNCFYREPQELVRSDLHKLLGRPVISLLELPRSVDHLLPLFVTKHSDPHLIALRKVYLESKKAFYRKDKKATKSFHELHKGLVMPITFKEFCGMAAKLEDEHPLMKISRNLKCQLSERDVENIVSAPDSYRALCTWFIIMRILPFARASHLASPDKGDSVDIRHAVAGAHCDVFISRDKGLRDLLSLVSHLLPYAVKSPEEFLCGNA